MPAIRACRTFNVGVWIPFFFGDPDYPSVDIINLPLSLVQEVDEQGGFVVPCASGLRNQFHPLDDGFPAGTAPGEGEWRAYTAVR